MSDPATKPPFVANRYCDPIYEFEKRLPNGEKICLPRLVGKLRGGPIAGGIPPSRDALIFEEDDEVSRDQTKPRTGTAEYSCTTKMPYTEDRTVTRDVSVPKIPNESEETTRARLEQAAQELTKTITGCHGVKFERLQPIANGHTKAVVPPSKQTTEIANKCDDKWATQPACRK